MKTSFLFLIYKDPLNQLATTMYI